MFVSRFPCHLTSLQKMKIILRPSEWRNFFSSLSVKCGLVWDGIMHDWIPKIENLLQSAPNIREEKILLSIERVCLVRKTKKQSEKFLKFSFFSFHVIRCRPCCPSFVWCNPGSLFQFEIYRDVDSCFIDFFNCLDNSNKCLTKARRVLHQTDNDDFSWFVSGNFMDDEIIFLQLF